MMKSLLQKAALIFVALTLFMLPQETLAARGQAFSPQQEAQIRRIQDYLNGIRTLRADFSQEVRGKPPTRGKMYLKRLGRESFGKLRLEYAPPVSTKIIANGETLRHKDGETQEVNDYSIDSTPASFLLRHKIDFFNDLEVKKMETKGDKIYLTVLRPGDDGVALTLIFVISPMLRLQEWTVVDAQANETHVVLKDVEIGVDLDENLFAF